ncbi:MarR family transcriptional regulator [Patulibacter sp. NPDC049589]|uniref:MarR family winged helix-turn-helix transcriptional regulator n=1 Tax=Patulibacter sp. NPDC049589 TaxID=3154731 RepID=UPI00343E3EDD
MPETPSTSPPDDAPAELSMLLDDQLCFGLYSASRAVTGMYRRLLGPLELTYPQYLAMLVLWDRGTLPVGALGEALDLDYGTLSPLLKRLEARGVVRRERRADDERSVLVALTDEGEALRERARRVPTEMGRAMGLDAAELAVTRRTLERLTRSVVAATAA